LLLVVSQHEHVNAVTLHATSNTQRADARDFRHVFTQLVEVLDPALLLCLEFFKPGQQDCRDVLTGAHVEAQRMMAPTLSATTCAADVVERISTFEDLEIVGRKRTTFTTRQILRRLKTESRRVADSSHSAEIVNCSVRLRGVFEQYQRMTLRDVAQRSHVGGLTKQVNRHDR